MELLGRNRAGCAGDRPAERPHSSAKRTRAHAFYPSLRDPKPTLAVPLAERGLDDWSGEDYGNVLWTNAGAKFGADNHNPCGYFA
jgi:hypothetical protein